MSTRSTIILAAVAGVLGAYVWFVELSSPTTDELAADRKRVLPEMQRDQVKTLQMTRGTETVVLERRADDWVLSAPLAYPADRNAVDAILAGLEFLEFERRLDEAGVRDKPEFGLASPSVVVEVPGTKVPKLILGGADATGRNVYLARADEPAVFVVEKHFFEAVTKSLDDLRDRRAVVFDRERLARLRVGNLELVREHEVWRVEKPERMLAARKRVDALLDWLDGLKVTRFLSETPEGSATHTLTVNDGQESRLEVLPSCGEHLGEVAVKRRGSVGADFCLSSEITKQLEMGDEEIRETRLLSVRPDEIASLELRREGWGVTLTHEQGAWWLAEPARLRADDDAVLEWLRNLGSFKAVEVSKPTGGAAGATRLNVVMVSGLEIHTQLARQQSGFIAQRGGETLALHFPVELGKHLDIGPLDFRSRKLLAVSRYDVIRLEGTVGGQGEVLEKKEGEWKFLEPAGEAADSKQMNRLLELLADLRVEGYVASAATPAHGLGSPTRSWRISVQQVAGLAPDGGAPDGGEIHRLVVGADAAQGRGCFVRAGGVEAPVARISPDDCRTLRSGLAERSLFEIAEGSDDALEAVTIRYKGQLLGFEKRGPEWYTADSKPLSAEKSRELIRILREARASFVSGYGKPAKAGLASPRLIVELRQTGAARQRIEVGSPYRGNGTVVGFFASVGSRKATYVVEKRWVDEVTNFKP